MKPKTGFFALEKKSEKAALYQAPTLFKTTEWGLLTIASLLAAFAFPPYFITVLWLAFFNAGGLLWVMHLSEKGRLRLRQFEEEFSLGHRHEEEGRFRDAVAHYEALVPKYQDFPRIAEIARRRVEYLKQSHPHAFHEPSSASSGKSALPKPRKKKR